VGLLAEASCEQVIDMLGDITAPAVADPDERGKLAYPLVRPGTRADERAEQLQGTLSLFLAELGPDPDCRCPRLPCAYGPLTPVITMEALWPELAGQRRPFEVVVTLPRADGGELLVPRQLPAEVLGCWSADQVVLSVTVLASRPSVAVAVAEVLVPELATAAGAVVTARPAGASVG
jgi:hypothetical protein